MYCPNCGKEIAENSRFCQHCGKGLHQQQPAPPSVTGPPMNIPTYLAQAILVTLFCCLPFGIVAIVYAAQVNGKLQMGDYAGALASSNNAKTWCWVSLGAGIAIGIIYFFIVIIAGAGFSRY